MFVKRVSESLLILGFSCTRIQHTVAWLKKQMPTVQEIHIYIPLFGYQHIVEDLNDPAISIHLHDIPLLTSDSERDSLVEQIQKVASKSIRICIVQDPVSF